MKTTKLLSFAAALFMSAALLAQAQPTAMPGSIMGNGVEVGPMRRNGPATGIRTDLTLDFKVVTVGSQTWAWTRLHGAAPDAFHWASQLRYMEVSLAAGTEINLTGRAAGGVTFNPAPVRNAVINSVPISFFQSVGGRFYETAEDFIYDRTIANSADPADTEPPVLAPPVIVSQTHLQMNLTLSASDNSGHFFFLIEDAENDIRVVSFTSNAAVPLLRETQHHFKVWAIDFSGNVSNVQTVSNEVMETPFFTQGQAWSLNFRLDSRSLTELVIDVTSASRIADAFVWLYMNNVRIPGEWKPDIDLDVGTFSYQIVVPASEVAGWAEGAVLALNLGYCRHPPDWGCYVIDNRVVTAGPHTGAPILHRIGTGPNGVNINEREAAGITIHQAGNMIVINSDVEITSAVMFTASGQQVATALNGNQIDISALASGVYLLQVNGTNVFRVVVR